jgi:hypothetical protein
MTNSMRVSTQRPLLRGHQRRDVCKGNLRRSFNDRRRRLGADEHGNPQHRRGKETSLRYRVDPEVDLASALSIIEGVLECVRVNAPAAKVWETLRDFSGIGGEPRYRAQ